MSALPLTKKLSLGDTVRHPQHGVGEVVKIRKKGEYPVDALFKDSPLLRLKVPVTVCLTLDGHEVGSGVPFMRVKIISKGFN